MCAKTLRKFDTIIELTSTGKSKRNALGKPDVDKAIIESTKYKETHEKEIKSYI